MSPPNNERADNTDLPVINYEDDIPTFGCGAEAIDAEFLL
jgi:hypothetical protein